MAANQGVVGGGDLRYLTDIDFQDGNDSYIIIGKQQAWNELCKVADMIPVVFEAQSLGLVQTSNPVPVERFTGSASSLKNQQGRITAGGDVTLQIHTDDMQPWWQQIMHDPHPDSKTIGKRVINNIRAATGHATTDVDAEIDGETPDLTGMLDLDESDATAVPTGTKTPTLAGMNSHISIRVEGVKARQELSVQFVVVGDGIDPNGTKFENKAETFTFKGLGDEANRKEFSQRRYSNLDTIQIKSKSLTEGGNAVTDGDEVKYLIQWEQAYRQISTTAALVLGADNTSANPIMGGTSSQVEGNKGRNTGTAGTDSTAVSIQSATDIHAKKTHTFTADSSRTRGKIRIVLSGGTVGSGTIVTVGGQRLTGFDSTASQDTAIGNYETLTTVTVSGTTASGNLMAISFVPVEGGTTGLLGSDESPAASPNTDPPISPARLMIVTSGTTTAGTICIQGYDQNGDYIYEDIDITATAGLYYSENYYAEGRTFDGQIIGLGTVPQHAIKIFGDGEATSAGIKVYAESNTFETQYDNAQGVLDGLTIEELKGTVPNVYEGMLVSNSTIDFSEVITINASFMGRRGYLRRSLYDIENSLPYPSLDPTETENYRDVARDVMVDWAAILEIGTTEADQRVIPITSASFDIQQNIDYRVRSDGTRFNQKPTRTDKRMINLTTSVDYTKITQVDDPNEYPDWTQWYLQNRELASSLTFFHRPYKGPRYQTLFQFGRLQLTADPDPAVTNFGPIVHSIAFKALATNFKLADEMSIRVQGLQPYFDTTLAFA